MNKKYDLKVLKNAGRARTAELSLRNQVRNFFRSAVEATDPQVFYFSMNGMVMPLSRRA